MNVARKEIHTLIGCKHSFFNRPKVLLLKLKVAQEVPSTANADMCKTHLTTYIEYRCHQQNQLLPTHLPISGK